MLIRDLERKTGLDRATIRFYEKERLIAPTRQENGYRTYSEADQDTLMKIKLLRQLGFPLGIIRELQSGGEELSEALTEQIRRLDAQISGLNRAREVCREIHEAGASYETLDAAYYLDALNRSVKKFTKSEFREPIPREYHPCRRFLARMLDYQLLNCLIRFLLIAVLRVRPFRQALSTIITYGVPFLMIPINAAFLHFFGTTPGKWVFGLGIKSENGGNLGFAAARDREWHVLHRGLGFGIPVWEYWCLYRSYRDYGESEMEWDWESDYQYEKWSSKRKAALIGAILFLVFVTIFNANYSILPKNRGELTISEFSENYNFYLTLTADTVSTSQKLQPNGTWYPEPEGSVTIYIDGRPQTPRQTFGYETEDGILRRITYENSWTEVFYVSPITVQCKIAALTAVMSQKGTDAAALLTKIRNPASA